jgi:hypothetical protein
MSIVAGTLAGALVLGAGGRLLMSGLVLVGGGHPSWSVGGSLTVLLVGTGYGALGGVLLPPVRRVCGDATLPAGAVLGIVLFGLAWVTSLAGRGAASGLGGRLPLALGLAAGTFVGYGLLTAWLFARYGGDRRLQPTTG